MWLYACVNIVCLIFEVGVVVDLINIVFGEHEFKVVNVADVYLIVLLTYWCSDNMNIKLLMFFMLLWYVIKMLI